MRRLPLDPIVKRISTEYGHRYDQCKATVELEISDGNGGRKDITVEYPLQEGYLYSERNTDLHLAALMEEKTSSGGKKEIPHYDKMEMAGVILKSIGLKGT